MECAVSTTGWADLITIASVCACAALIVVHMVVNCRGRKKVLHAVLEHQRGLAEGAVKAVIDDHHETAEGATMTAATIGAQTMLDDVLRQKLVRQRS